MLNIVIPMAGEGSRFAAVGYKVPKPLIEVQGQPMIRLVLENLRPSQVHRFIFICRQAHLRAYPIAEQLAQWSPGCEVVSVDELTQGAACSVLLARQWIDSDTPLMIANSDQWVDIRIDEYLDAMPTRGLDGQIMTMHATDPKWSYVALDAANNVKRVAEKEVISNEATVGIYNFARGSDFVAAAQAMVDADLRVKGEFYVAPVYQQLIDQGARIGVYNIGSEAAGMYGLGIPEDLALFERLPVCVKALEPTR